MTLATRCPACGTVFRVVQDQLRVSEGWVRCGRCAEVFNAVEHFVDAATAGLGVTQEGGAGALRGVAEEATAHAPQAQPAAAEPHALAPPAPDDDLVPPIEIDTATGPAGTDRPDGHLAAGPDDHRAPDAAPVDDLAADPSDRFVPVPAGGVARVAVGAPLAPAPPAAPALPAAKPHRTPADGAATTGAALPMPPQPVPSFLRQADRAARWRQPRVRAALAAGCMLAALALAAQAAHTWRDLLAARWPALQPPLARACALLGCTLQPPRRIDAWVVDGSALLRVDAAPQTGLYRLSLSLHHRAAHALALPALDLTLTDTQGRVLVRRVLLPSELADAPAALAAGAGWTTNATLQSEGAPIAGYTIELFYP